MTAPAIELEGATVLGDGGQRVIDAVTLGADPGSVTALVGPAGSGKTTILRLLASLATPSAGTVRVGGVDLATLDYRGLRAHRVSVGYVFEAGGLPANLTLGDAIALPMRYHAQGRLSDVDIDRRVRGIAEELRIEEHLRAPAFRANESVRKRALFARALAMSPSLLLCDEPQAGMTPDEARHAAAAIDRRRRSHEITVVLADHDGVLEPFAADRIVWLRQGRVHGAPALSIAAPRPSMLPAMPSWLPMAQIYGEEP